MSISDSLKNIFSFKRKNKANNSSLVEIAVIDRMLKELEKAKSKYQTIENSMDGANIVIVLRSIEKDLLNVLVFEKEAKEAYENIKRSLSELRPETKQEKLLLQDFRKIKKLISDLKRSLDRLAQKINRGNSKSLKGEMDKVWEDLTYVEGIVEDTKELAIEISNMTQSIRGAA